MYQYILFAFISQLICSSISCLGLHQNYRRIRCIPQHSIAEAVAIAEPSIVEQSEDTTNDTVAQLLASKNNDSVSKLMKMERKSTPCTDNYGRWFPYLDKFCANGVYLDSAEVLEVLDPLLLDVRKERFRNVVKHRSYGICLVVEGLTDFGNVSAAFRSADALGFQSVHVISCGSKRWWINTF